MEVAAVDVDVPKVNENGAVAVVAVALVPVGLVDSDVLLLVLVPALKLKDGTTSVVLVAVVASNNGTFGTGAINEVLGTVTVAEVVDDDLAFELSSILAVEKAECPYLLVISVAYLT